MEQNIHIDWDQRAEAQRQVISTYAKTGGRLKSTRNLTAFIAAKHKARIEGREPTSAELALCDDLTIVTK